MTVKSRRIILDLDELDWDTIQGEFSRRQGGLRMADGWLASVPDGESNLAGAMLAEIVRGFTEYHELYLAQIKSQRLSMFAVPAAAQDILGQMLASGQFNDVPGETLSKLAVYAARSLKRILEKEGELP